MQPKIDRHGSDIHFDLRCPICRQSTFRVFGYIPETDTAGQAVPIAERGPYLRNWGPDYTFFRGGGSLYRLLKEGQQLAVRPTELRHHHSEYTFYDVLMPIFGFAIDHDVLICQPCDKIHGWSLERIRDFILAMAAAEGHPIE